MLARARLSRIRRVFGAAEREDLLQRLLAGERFAAVATDYHVSISMLRRQFFQACRERNPDLWQRLGSPNSVYELRKHARDFGMEGPSWRSPYASRDAAIVERFAAGEGYRELAWDYALSTERIAQIIQHFSLAQDWRRHEALCTECRRALRPPQAVLRTHIQALLAEEGADDAC